VTFYCAKTTVFHTPDWKFSEEIVARKRLKTTALKQGALYI